MPVVAAYLYRAVHNESLNWLKHQKIKAGHQLHIAYSMKNKSETIAGKMQQKELENKFRQALNELPEQDSLGIKPYNPQPAGSGLTRWPLNP